MDKQFKIHQGYGLLKPCKVKFVPWSFVEDCEQQAHDTHSQTLARLNERGGLSPKELYAVKHGMFVWHCKKTEQECIQWLEELFP